MWTYCCANSTQQYLISAKYLKICHQLVDHLCLLRFCQAESAVTCLFRIHPDRACFVAPKLLNLRYNLENKSLDRNQSLRQKNLKQRLRS